MIEYVLDYLKMNDVEYREDVEMRSLSSVKIGGLAEIVAFPHREEELLKLVRFLTNAEIPYKVLGRMTNVLPNDSDYHGIIVITDRFSEFYFDKTLVYATAGVSLPLLALMAERIGLSGFEEVAGIPGSIAGSVIGNAGAFGKEVGQIVDSVRFYDIESDSIVQLSANECLFSYRSSRFKGQKGVLLSACFSLYDCNALEIKKRRIFFKEKRLFTQPSGIPSLGSTFKRPLNNVSAGKLIEECGLKGFSVGDAEISTKHAGFIVNKGNATAKDYLATAEVAVDRVLTNFGIKLEYEIEVM